MYARIPTPNKILCLTAIDSIFYSGDNRGNLLEIDPSKNQMETVNKANFPISAVCIGEKKFCGNWNGDIYCVETSAKINLGNGIIKGIVMLKEKLIAGIEKKVYILTQDLEVLEQYETKQKVQCMYSMDEKSVIIGCSLGCLGVYDGSYHFLRKSGHEQNILSIASINGRIVTGSCDGTVRVEDEKIYEGNQWIRSVCSYELFSSGNNVIRNNKILFSHNDHVTAIKESDKYIVSVGLDGCIIVYSKTENYSDNEVRSNKTC